MARVHDLKSQTGVVRGHERMDGTSIWLTLGLMRCVAISGLGPNGWQRRDWYLMPRGGREKESTVLELSSSLREKRGIRWSVSMVKAWVAKDKEGTFSLIRGGWENFT